MTQHVSSETGCPRCGGAIIWHEEYADNAFGTILAMYAREAAAPSLEHICRDTGPLHRMQRLLDLRDIAVKDGGFSKALEAQEYDELLTRFLSALRYVEVDVATGRAEMDDGGRSYRRVDPEKPHTLQRRYGPSSGGAYSDGGKP